jgi:hypothetical protein
MAKTLQDLMPANTRKNWKRDQTQCLSSHDIFKVLKDDRVIIMACNED